MASMGCFPCGVETKTDASVLLHTVFCRRPRLPPFAFRLRTVHNLARGSSKIGEDRINISNGGWSRRLMLVEAIGNASVGEEENDGEADDAFQATIEKSKKVLAMQRDLLQQIAERRKLVSSIKTSTMNLEVEEVLSHGQDRPFLNEGLESTESESMITGQMNKEKPFSNQRMESIDSGTASAGYNNDSPSSGYPKLIAKRASISVPSTGQSDFGEDKKEYEQTLPVDTATPKVDFSERLRDTDPENVQSDNLPTFLSIPFETSSSEKEKIGHSEEKRSNEILSQSSDQVNEDNKLPPLAGVNVMNLILIAAECAPWSKTGGLADVAGALPKALARRGHRVMAIVPRYGNYAEAQETGVRKTYKVDGQDNEVTYYHAFVDGVDFVFVDAAMFRHIENNIYGGNRMEILKRMILFCKAAVEVPWHVPCGGVCYGDGNLVFIANDWHTALLPVYLKAYYRDNGLMTYTRSLLVIHNIAHQGRGPLTDFSYVDLPQHYIDLFKLYDPVGGEHFNIFAAGLKTADRVVTVSHGYAWELKTVEGGWGLHGIINENDWKLAGIVNGIDTNDWHPQVDVHLRSDGYTNYSLETLKTGKAQCKAALQRELGLPIREDVPLLGFIGRLDGQKGVDIIAEAIPWMMGQDVQLVMLGTGRDDLEQMLRDFESQYGDRVRSWVGFSVKMAHRITAGVDILLMPSRFEPCGLNQLYAMVYGTVPVVHAVGGLRDTVQPFDPYNECGLGWTFDRAEANMLINALGNCLLTFREYKNSWEGIQRRGMTQNLSWDIAAEKYEEILVAAKYHW